MRKFNHLTYDKVSIVIQPLPNVMEDYLAIKTEVKRANKVIKKCKHNWNKQSAIPYCTECGVHQKSLIQ